MYFLLGGEDLVELILKLIGCHLLGDYVLQGEFIATTKGKNYYHLFVHSFLYCVPFYLVFGLSLNLLILFGMHLIVDNLKARYGVITYIEDQMIHYVTLIMYLL